MKRVLVGCMAMVLAAGTARAAEREFACADYTAGKVFVIAADGRIAWQSPAPNCNDLWVLPNGNLLFTTGHGVKEVTRDGKTVFEYTSRSEIYACQRLENGNTFVGECNAGRLLELAPDGTMVKEVRLLPEGKDGGHAYMRNARRLPDGHYLVTHYGESVVREYDAGGRKVWEVKAPGGPHSVARLPDGNTLVSTGDRAGPPTLLEFDRAGKLVWSLTNNDLPGKPLRFCTGFHRLPNGNTVLSNWLGHGQFGKAPHLLEVTREKNVVWSWENHKDLRTVSSVVVLKQDGRDVPGPALH